MDDVHVGGNVMGDKVIIGNHNVINNYTREG